MRRRVDAECLTTLGQGRVKIPIDGCIKHWLKLVTFQEYQPLFPDINWDMNFRTESSYFLEDNDLPPFSFKLLYSQLTGQELET